MIAVPYPDMTRPAREANVLCELDRWESFDLGRPEHVWFCDETSGPVVPKIGEIIAAPSESVQFLFSAVFTGIEATLSDEQVRTLFAEKGWTVKW